jgi:hypothetical protein
LKITIKGYDYLKIFCYFRSQLVVMKNSLSERNLVIALFVLVFITFAFAQEDSKKLEQLYSGEITTAAARLANLPENTISSPLVTSGAEEKAH